MVDVCQQIITGQLLLDTMIFNRLLDGQILLSVFDGFELFATYVQEEELRQTCDSVRRDKLLECFKIVPKKMLPAETFMFGVSGAGLGQAKWPNGDGLYERIEKAVAEEDKKDRKKCKKLRTNPENHIYDALSAEVAIRNNLALITNDKSLLIVVPTFGGTVISWDDFLRMCSIETKIVPTGGTGSSPSP